MSKDPIRLQTEIEYSDHTRINTLMRSDQTRILTDDGYMFKHNSYKQNGEHKI